MLDELKNGVTKEMLDVVKKEILESMKSADSDRRSTSAYEVGTSPAFDRVSAKSSTQLAGHAEVSVAVKQLQ